MKQSEDLKTLAEHVTDQLREDANDRLLHSMETQLLIDKAVAENEIKWRWRLCTASLTAGGAAITVIWNVAIWSYHNFPFIKIGMDAMVEAMEKSK